MTSIPACASITLRSSFPFKGSNTVSRPRTSRSRRIPKARPVRRSPLGRVDVTRGEYNRIVDILNERNVILNGLRDALERLENASDIQFKRIAQIQADLDVTRQARDRIKRRK